MGGKSTTFLAVVMTIGMVFVYSVRGQAPARSADNSNLWEKMDDGAKFGYILGFSNASENYQMVLRAERGGCDEITNDHLTGFLDQNPLPHAPMLRWKSLVDEFYQDQRNRGINLVFAMQIASLRIAERPQPDIDLQLQQMRELSKKP